MNRKGNVRGRITLARVLSKFGVSSRSLARRLVVNGRVRLNGRAVRTPDTWVDPQRDTILIDGKPLRQRAHVYVMMNKPTGVMTTRSDELQRRTVYDYLPGGSGWLFPVGRLDKDTSGLLLFTDDTRFGERVTNPLTQTPKTYAVQLDRSLTAPDRGHLQSELQMKDGTSFLPATAILRSQDPTRCEITIVEGKNRQVRRMFDHLGYKVLGLKRLSIGSLRLGSLPEGEVRKLSRDEVAQVLQPRSK